MYVVYTRWVAFELRKLGFKIEKVEPNPNKPEFDCYFFKDSKALQDAMRAIHHRRKD